MNQHHDPIRQENYLRQCLAQDKRPLGFFVGAGCPLAIRVTVDGTSSPLIPDIAGLTRMVCDEMLSSNAEKKTFEIVLAHFETDGNKAPNIEDILSHIRALRVVAGGDNVRGMTADDLDKLDDGICNKIVALVEKSLTGSDTPYHKFAAWVGATQRVEPVEIFTSNYDLLIEQALEENRVPYFDGFVGSHRTFFDPAAMDEDKLPARWARLWKLHGSVNWRQDERGIVSRGEKVVNNQRWVIHPSHLKYDESRRMPYLAMIDRLRAFLRKPSSVLIVVGYSFRDDHINEIMLQGLQGNPTAIAFALLFGKLQKYEKAVELSCHRANLSLLAEDEAVIGTRRSKWIDRQEQDDVIQSPAIEWVPVNDQNSDGLKQARFKLGDFVRLGGFLEDLIGHQKATEEAANER